MEEILDGILVWLCVEVSQQHLHRKRESNGLISGFNGIAVGSDDGNTVESINADEKFSTPGP